MQSIPPCLGSGIEWGYENYKKVDGLRWKTLLLYFKLFIGF